MPPSRRNERVVRFGVYEFRPDTQELRKDGLRIRVQAKPLQILRTLVDRPGELITREELQNTLWPEGTFVDFEGGLNTATNRLRAALNDSADQPRYIETRRRLGYRFICPVQDIARETGEADSAGVVALELNGTPHSQARQIESIPIPLFVAPAKHRQLNVRLAVTLFLLITVLAGLAVYSHFFRTNGPSTWVSPAYVSR
jgi:cholera toxin transcriptional activator